LEHDEKQGKYQLGAYMDGTIVVTTCKVRLTGAGPTTELHLNDCQCL